MSISLQILGFIHLVHGPALIALPFLIDTYINDLLYLNYFFIMIYSYAFFHREFPITYIAKWIENPQYIPGSNPLHFPEMIAIISTTGLSIETINDISIYLFMTTSIGYMISILYVIQRLYMPYQLLLIPFSTIGFYIGFPGKIQHRRDFLVYQEIVKNIMLISMFFTTNAILFNL